MERESRLLSNPLGLSGHDWCQSQGKVGGEERLGVCYNELECVASGGAQNTSGKTLLVDNRNETRNVDTDQNTMSTTPVPVTYKAKLGLRAKKSS